MTELLLCPFCGESKELTKSESFVNCESCLCQALKMRWNTRHSPWISVKDNVPTEKQLVLVYAPNEKILKIRIGLFDDWINIDHTLEITQWMQLPNKPKETE